MMMNIARFKKMALGLLTFGCTLLWQTDSLAEAWVQEKGDALFITTAGWYVSTDAFNQGHHRHEASRYRQLQINPYVEYGATDRLTVGTNILLVDIDQKNGGQRTTGWADVELFGRYLMWWNKRNVLTAQAIIKLPGNASRAQAGFGGADQVDIELDALYGISGRFGKSDNYWFTDWRLGFRKRFEKPSDEIHAGFIWGIKTCEERLWFLLKNDSIFGTKNADHNGPDYDLHTIEPSVLYWFKDNYGLQVGARYDYAGRNVGAGTEPYVSLWFRV
jgi:hypothetical protein